MSELQEMRDAVTLLEGILGNLGSPDDTIPWWIMPDRRSDMTSVGVEIDGTKKIIAESMWLSTARYVATMHPGMGVLLLNAIKRAIKHVEYSYTCCDSGVHQCSEFAAPYLEMARLINRSEA